MNEEQYTKIEMPYSKWQHCQEEVADLKKKVEDLQKALETGNYIKLRFNRFEATAYTGDSDIFDILVNLDQIREKELQDIRDEYEWKLTPWYIKLFLKYQSWVNS